MRFSSEDSFRSNLVDLLSLYQAVDVSEIQLVKSILQLTLNSKRVAIVWELPTRLDARRRARYTSSCGLSEAWWAAISKPM